MTVKVYVPRDAAALSVGAEAVAHRLDELAGDKIEIIRNGSRGMLWLEPLVEVETTEGRVAYGPVKAQDLEILLEAGMLEGSSHELCQGLTEDIPYFKNQQRLTFERVGVIDPLDIAAYEAHGGLAGLKTCLDMSPQSIVDAVKTSGLRGRGGAGFPTGIKWDTALAQNSEQKYICANADEGDSGTFADRMLMEGDPFSLIEGMIIGGRAIGANTGYIYIRSEYPHAIRTMRAATELMYRHGWLGNGFDLYIRVGAGAYICGEESSMLDSLEGKRGQVRAKPPIPAISGLHGQPTIVNNVLTLATIPWILREGAQAYADFGLGRSRGTQPFQLAGNIKHGGLIESAFGVSIDTLIHKYGGGTLSGKDVKTVQIGGPLGAYMVPDQFDTEMGYESLAEAGGMMGHGGLVVHDADADIVDLARYAMEFCEVESCGKCTPCRIGAVRGRETLEKIHADQNVEQNLLILEDLCDVMEDASLCAMGGLTPMPVRSALRHFPHEFYKGHKEAAE